MMKEQQNQATKSKKDPRAAKSKAADAKGSEKSAAAQRSREVLQSDRERAENEGMIAKAPESTPRPAMKDAPSELEGEGSYTAARRYREGVEESIEEGKTEELADAAAESLDGAEGPELRRAEHAAKRGRVA
jgi:hypothetical protein